MRTNNPVAVQAYADSHNLTVTETASLATGDSLITLAQAPNDPRVAGLSKTVPATQTGPEVIYHAAAVPNDPIYPQYYSDKISLPAAWDISTGSSSVKVADIDTGFAMSHQDLTNKWAINSGEFGGGKNTNGVDDDGNSKIDDWRGWDFVSNDNNPSTSSISHGTETAGLIAAEANNSLGVAGTSWLSTIVPLRVLDNSGSGTTTAVIQALAYARSLGVKVANLSLGSTSPDSLLQTEIDNDINAGMTVVAAAGNCGDADTYVFNNCAYDGQVIYPANYPEVVAVGATDLNDARAGFSSFGPNLDLMAPGSGALRSTTISGGNTTSAYSSTLNGTSYSAPIVSGVAALMYAHFPTITPAQVAAGLIASVDKVAGMNGANRTDQYGYGRVNAQNALKIDSLPCPYPILKTFNNGLVSNGQRIIAYRYGSGSLSYLTYTQLNNTGSACAEAHVWTPGYQNWAAHIATGMRATDPAGGMLVPSLSSIDGKASLNYVTFGNVEVHRFSPDLQKMPGYYDVPANLNASANLGTFLAGNFFGNGNDYLAYILYQGNNGGMEIHLFDQSMTKAVGFYDLPTDIGAVNNGTFVAGDFLGRGYDQLAYVSYGNTEVHLFDIRNGRAARIYEVPTNLTGTSAATGTFVAGDFLGAGHSQLQYVIYSNGTGRVETHMFDQSLTRINGTQDIITNLPGFTP